MGMKKDGDVFQTSDLGLAAALSCRGFKLIDLVWGESHKATFVFERGEELNSAIEQYWADSLLIEPKAYFSQLKTIKTRLYERK